MRRIREIGIVVAVSLLAACHGGGGGDGGAPPPGPTYTVGGTVAGLGGSGLVLRNNGSDSVTVSGAQFTFPTALASGAAYAVTVQTQPASPTQDCVVGSGSGTIAAANVTSVTVTCTMRSFTVGGTVTGLTSTGLTLRDVGGTVVAVGSGATAFQFPAAQSSGSTYFVSIASQPSGGSPAQVCTLSNGGGVVGGADVASIKVVCNAGVAHYLAALNFSSGNVNVLHVVNSGVPLLSTAPGSPYATGPNPTAMAATPGGDYLYVLSSAPGTVAAFTVNPTGVALTPVAGSPFTVTGGAAALDRIYLDPSGRFMYFQQSNSSSFYGYSVNPASGALTPIVGSPFTAPTGTAWLGFDPLLRYAYTLGSKVAASFRLDNATGALTMIGTPLTLTASGSTVGLVHPTGSFLYGAFQTGGTEALKVDLATGQLTSLGTVPDGGRFASIDPTGRFLYLSGGNVIGGYQISSTTGVLASIPGQPFAADQQTEDFGIDPAGKYLYAPAVLGSQGPILGYKIDSTTGALTPVPGSPKNLGPGANPNVVRLDPAGFTLYVASFGDDKIRTIGIDLADGSFSLGSTLNVPNGSSGLMIVGTQ